MNTLLENKPLHWRVLLLYIESETIKKGKRFMFESEVYKNYILEKSTYAEKKFSRYNTHNALLTLINKGYVEIGLGQIGDRVGRVVVHLRSVGENEKQLDTDYNQGSIPEGL